MSALLTLQLNAKARLVAGPDLFFWFYYTGLSVTKRQVIEDVFLLF